jgi:biopolymer transport protein ExbD
MMLRKNKTKTTVAYPGMIPMIDLVFQLLAFFIIVINFETTKADERLKLPKDMIARPPVVSPEHELILTLGYPRDDSEIQPNSIPVVIFSDRYVEIRQMGPELERERRLIEKIHGREVLKDVTVLIRGESDIPAGLAQELIQKCQESGFTKFLLRTAVEDRR